MNCPTCQGEVLDIDVKCAHCGAVLGATGAHRMLGNVMLGQYELMDVLGQGGMSVVFKGKHKLTDQEVALKILPPELAAHSQVKSRFLDEAKALAALDHPNIVHLYNFGQENGYFVLAMQYVKGDTWERIILENKRIDWPTSCRYTIDVLKALEYAHGRGVVHRDMKPSNVLVRAHDAMATVMDFGIAKMTTSTRLTATGQTMGTVRYMSPEQVRGQEVDLRTDLYSLGATLYESLVGDTPFDGSTHFEIMTKHLSEVPRPPSALGIEVPALVEEALMRSLAKKPADRFENAREMRKLLEAALREGDLGLIETQKLNRDVLGEVRPAATTPPPTVRTSPRVATATPTGSLADQLEPGATGPVPTPHRRASPAPSRRWMWIGLAALLLGGGAAATAILIQGGDPPASTGIKGVIPTGRGVVDGVTIESGGTVTTDQLATTYRNALVKLRGLAEAEGVTFVDPVHEIVAIPRAAFCEPTAYPDDRVPQNCATLVAQPMIGASKGAHRLLVLDQAGELARAMEIGVADAVCFFEPDRKAAGVGCKLAEQFRKAATGR